MTGRLLLPLTDDVLNLLAHGVERDVERLEGLGCNAFALVNETEQNVLGADVVVIEHLGFFLSQDHDATSTIGKSLKHCHSSDYVWLSVTTSTYLRVTSAGVKKSRVRRGREQSCGEEMPSVAGYGEA